MFTVLGRPTSINVRKVLWTADELGMQYTHESEWADNKAVNTPEFKTLNPNALVPVLLDSDAVLWESNPICRYLAAKHERNDLLPPQPLARAQVEKWMDWQATSLTTVCRYAFMGLVRHAPEYQDDEETTRSANQWNKAILIIEKTLETGGLYIAADHFTLADVVIGLSIHRWRITPIEHAPTPMVDSYMERLSRRQGARWFNQEFAVP